MLEVMERKIHGPLKCGSNIFETKRNFTICECTLWADECHFLLVFGFDLDLIIS
jgi:hypothetical protein